MSEATYRLVQGYFECQALGEQTLRGVAAPVQVYRVLQESGARGRLDVAVTRGLTPLVGRDSEVTLLQERWAQAKSGQGQVVLLTGDPGIGKSRLVQMLKDHVANEPHVRWECRSSEYSQNSNRSGCDNRNHAAACDFCSLAGSREGAASPRKAASHAVV